MLSIVIPCPAREKVCKAAREEFWNADGGLDTGPEIDIWCSWLVPYIIRAKLRFDMIPSRRILRGYRIIVHPSVVTGGN
jgi:hypothetical protein